MITSRRRAAAAVLAVCSAAAVAPLAHAAAPSNEEQYFLELINRMRIDPQRELSHMVNLNPGSPATWGDPISDDPDITVALDFFQVDPATLVNQWQSLTPAPALAWNDRIHDAAVYHNEQMILHQMQEHQLPGEPDLGQRLLDAGYDYQFGGENIYAYSESVVYGHAAFAIDWGFGPGGIQTPAGHRDNIMDRDFREIGIAITRETDPNTEVGPLLITQDFGSEFGKVFVTGVIYNDSVQRDRFYTPGEGLDGITVRALLPGTQTQAGATQTTPSGGYSLPLPPGTYDIAIEGAGLTRFALVRNVALGTSNVKIDSLSAWINDGDGAWTNPANWFAGVPNGPGTIAALYDAATAQRTIDLPVPVTVGSLDLENPAGYRLAGPGEISLDGSAFPLLISVTGAGSHEIAVGLTLLDDAGININPQNSIAGTLTISGPLNYGSRALHRFGAGVVNIDGPQLPAAGARLHATGGTTNINSDSGSSVAAALHLHVANAGTVVNLGFTQHLGDLSIDGARVNLTRGGNKVLSIKSISAAPLAITAGQLDLNDNDMIVQSNADNRQVVLTDIVNLIKSARNAPNPWTGDGITSSAAMENPLTTLAAMSNPGLATFSGEPVDEFDILIKYTWNGDANLDGTINIDDYVQIDTGYLAQPENPSYADGNFNYDGTIDIDDYVLIDTAYLGQTGVLAASLSAVAAVPEPGVVLLSLAATASLFRRRRG